MIFDASFLLILLKGTADIVTVGSGIVKQVGEDVSSDFNQCMRYTNRLEFLVAAQEHSQRWL
jgi:hypothetical protein